MEEIPMSTELKIGAGLGILVVAISAWFFYTRSAGSPDIPLPGEKPIPMTGRADSAKPENGPSTGRERATGQTKPVIPPARTSPVAGRTGTSPKKPGMVRSGTQPKTHRPGRSARTGQAAPLHKTKTAAPAQKTPNVTGQGTSAAASERPKNLAGRSGSAQRRTSDQAASAVTRAPAGLPKGKTGSPVPTAGTKQGSGPRASGSRASSPAGTGASVSPGRRRTKALQTPRTTPGERKHLVQPGESFALIAQKYFGSQKYMWYVIQANPQVKDPSKLSVGQTLRIPPAPPSTASPSQQPRATGREKRAVAQRTYVVEAGDSFYDIAQRLMGDGTRWPELYELNKDQVGLDPSDLRVGQVLKIPPK
jgi:nucleoid-associated protein YgaU